MMSQDLIDQGIEHFRNARYPEAVSAFQTAADLNPGDAAPHLCLGLCRLQQYVPGALASDVVGHARRAETELRRALELEPANWIAFVLLGFLVCQHGRLEEACEWFRK